MTCPSCQSHDTETETLRGGYAGMAPAAPWKREETHRCRQCGHRWAETTYVRIY